MPDFAPHLDSDGSAASGTRPAAATRDDPLSDSLLFLAAHHGRALSRDALLAGLPIEDGRLHPPLYERAANRAGLEAKLVERRLLDIPALVLPVVLLLRDGSTLILRNIDLQKRRLTVCEPTRHGVDRIEHADALATHYSGFAYFVRPMSEADARTASLGHPTRPHWFWSVVKRFGASYGHVAIAALIVNLLALAAPLFVMSVYDRVIPNGAIPSLVALAIGLGIAIVFDFLFRIVRSRIIDMTGKKLDVVLASDIFEHIIALKMSQRPTSVGVLASELRDFDSVREFFTSGTVVSATDLLFAVIFVCVLFLIAGPLAWIPLVLLPVMLVIGFVIQRPLDRAMRRLQNEAAARHGILVESLSGIDAVRAIGGEARVQAKWERSVAASARSSEDTQFWSAMALTSAGSATQIASLLLTVVGVFMILDGTLSVGALVAANMLSGRVLGPIASIAAVITRGTQTLMALRAIDQVMALERERPRDKVFVAREIADGRIEFQNVSFVYPASTAKALDGVSFSVRPGEKVAIIGRIGSGKTTVGRLLVSFYEPTEGAILVDGVDVRQYDPADLRAGVGFMLQDTHLFFGKLRDNITYGKADATDAEVLEAARFAGVEAFVANHPEGYDMAIAEGGRSLSGGQKQAIGLARMLIRKPKILFLDEPTAHFDVRSEAEFLTRLQALANEKLTILISTHRPSVLSMVDRVIVFERGKIVADGPREDILARLRGRPAPPGPSPMGVSRAAV